MPENRMGLMPGGWGLVAGRFFVGLVGGVINALAAMSTVMGAIAYGIRQQEDD